MPRPISSSTTSDRRVAPRRTFAVSFISTMKVLSPLARLSLAPTRVSTRSTTPTCARRAGTNEPIWARITISAICRMNVDFPAMFGPVTSHKRAARSSPSVLESGEASSETSFGTKRPAAASRSTTGWRPSSIVSSSDSSTSGRTKSARCATSARALETSHCARR